MNLSHLIKLIQCGKYGFEILLGGLKGFPGFNAIGSGTAFWSSTISDRFKLYGLGVGGINPVINIHDSFGEKSGLYVRCIKDK